MVAARIDISHLGEFVPPLMSCLLYLLLYRHRARILATEGRPVSRWRRSCFVSGALLMTVVQVGPLDTLADDVLVAHMLQHILIGDIASLLIVLGLTGPVLQPLLQMRASRILRRLSHPLVALTLWAVDLYTWHLPFLYQLAIRHDLVHALEHACLLWCGGLLWLALIGPLPKPRWFSAWWGLGYVILVRFLGAILANVLIWAQTIFYPVYKGTDAARGLNPLSDQNLAGAVMMVEQIILTTALLGWLFYRLAIEDEERQQLLDLAADRGLELSEDRAERAVRAGAGSRLRERLLRDANGSDRAGDAAPPSASTG
ncbi:MAG TPA: cytochrome c oxidase assembly protein [Solirubrobacteraceae bacterium]|jgi:cytochrome c oxidase assembly factor CtaG|nr:cytochrome c oxidase assembly protein [Solirubrobacteraceae bacterium]